MENALTLFNVIGNESGGNYCSLDIKDKGQALLAYKAMSNPDEGLSNHINETLNIRHLFIQPVEMVDKQTGEMSILPRIVVFDDDGKSYVTISKGIYNSLRSICSICGLPENWKSSIKVKVLQRNIKEYKMLSLDVVDFGDNI